MENSPERTVIIRSEIVFNIHISTLTFSVFYWIWNWNFHEISYQFQMSIKWIFNYSIFNQRFLNCSFDCNICFSSRTWKLLIFHIQFIFHFCNWILSILTIDTPKYIHIWWTVSHLEKFEQKKKITKNSLNIFKTNRNLQSTYQWFEVEIPAHITRPSQISNIFLHITYIIPFHFVHEGNLKSWQNKRRCRLLKMYIDRSNAKNVTKENSKFVYQDSRNLGKTEDCAQRWKQNGIARFGICSIFTICHPMFPSYIWTHIRWVKSVV